MKEYYRLLIMTVYTKYGLVPPDKVSIKQLQKDLVELETTTAKEIAEVINEIKQKIEIRKSEIEKLKSDNKIDNRKIEIEKSDENRKSENVEIDEKFVTFVRKLKLYFVFISEELFADSGEKKLHERFTQPFIFTIALFTIEATVIHTHFWGSSLLAIIILLILNVLAYADQNSILPFVKYEGYKRLAEMKRKFDNNTNRESTTFTPSFSVIDAIYRNKIQNTFGVVRYLGVITFLISFIQFIFNGYHYDDVPEDVKLGVNATLNDLINRFYYIYTYKNILIAVFMGFLAHYTVKVSVKIELPKIFKEIIDQLEEEDNQK